MSNQTCPLDEEVLEYSPLHTSSSLSKLVDCQGQPLDTCERMESSFMEFLESVRIRAIESGTDMGHIEDSIVELVQSTDEYQQVKQLVSELMNRNQSLDNSLSEERDNKVDYEIRANQLEHELTLMREQMECVIKEADETNQLLDWKSCRERQLVELQKTATNYRFGLEQENQQLIDESRALKQEAISIDKKERALIKQCFEQLGSANRKIDILTSESQQREHANYALEDKVHELTKAVKQMQEHQNKLCEENDQLKQHLFSTYESHTRVAGHVLQLQSVNEEYKALLGDTQSQLHDLRSKTDILDNPQTPLSSEIESALALQSTPIESPQHDVNGTNQRLVPVHRPISPLVSNQVYSSQRDSSDSDSFICIRDPKKKFSQSDRVPSRRPLLPKSKSVTFLDISDTESTDEDPYGTKLKYKPELNHSSNFRVYSPECRPKFLNRKLLSHHGNVKLVKNVKGSVHLEKWRDLATARNDLNYSGPGIKRKSNKKIGGSVEDISSFFNDSNNSRQSPQDLCKNQTSKSSTGFINNLTETFGLFWKWKA